MGDINRITHVENVKLREDGRAVVIIDQSLLPGRKMCIRDRRSGMRRLHSKYSKFIGAYIDL